MSGTNRRPAPLAAYRAAFAKVEPDEAFLARTRQALAEAAEGAAPAPRGRQTVPRRPLGQALRPWLLPAACLALLLLVVPARGLLAGGGAGISGGAAAQAADEQLTVYSAAAAAEDTAAAETAPVEGAAGGSIGGPAGEPTSPPDAAPAPDAGAPLTDQGDGLDYGRDTGDAPAMNEEADGGTDGSEAKRENVSTPTASGEEAPGEDIGPERDGTEPADAPPAPGKLSPGRDAARLRPGTAAFAGSARAA